MNVISIKYHQIFTPTFVNEDIYVILFSINKRSPAARVVHTHRRVLPAIDTTLPNIIVYLKEKMFQAVLHIANVIPDLFPLNIIKGYFKAA